jgi:hypothetical protein
MSNVVIIRKSDSFSLASLGLVADLIFDDPLANTGQNINTANQYHVAAADPPLVNAVDRSQLKAPTTIYSSDFSAGVNGWSGANVTAAGNIDGINGQDNWLRATTLGLGTPNNALNKLSIGVNGTIARRRAKIYIDAANTANTGIMTYSTLNSMGEYVIGKGNELDLDILALHSATNQYLGSPLAATNTQAGDKFYIKNAIWESLAGNHFINITASARPTANVTDMTYDLDGSNDELDSAALATVIKNDTAGMVTMFIRDDYGSGVALAIMTFYQSVTVNFRVQFLANNRLSFNWIDPVNGNITVTSSIITRGAIGTWYKIQFGSDGSNFILYVDGVKITMTTDTSSWMSYLSSEITTVKIGITQGIAFGKFGLRHFGCRSGSVFTPTEIANINATSTYTP